MHSCVYQALHNKIRQILRGSSLVTEFGPDPSSRLVYMHRLFDDVWCCVIYCYLSSPLLDYIEKYATEQALRQQEHRESSSESEMSDLSEDEAQDMEL